MRFLHPSLGLTALVAAFAVGLRTEESPSGESLPPTTSTTTFRPASSSENPRSISSRREQRTRAEYPDPRLKELTRTLALSFDQQAQIHPAITRATLGYDPGMSYPLYQSDAPQFLGPPLTRADFEDALFAILDIEQQLDYAATTTEKEAWWQSVVSRLEADLDHQTSSAKHLPPPATPVPSQGRDRLLQLPPATD